MPPLSPLPVLISSHGNPSLDDEDLIAYELGYRVEATKHVSLDVAGFYNDYSQLIAQTAMTTSIFTGATPPYVQVLSTEENAGSADSYGVEISARWDVTDYWHLVANYSWLDLQLGFNSNYFQSGPEHQAQLRSSLDLPHHFELNGDVSFVDQVTTPALLGQISVPSYVRLDLGLVWHPTKNLELGIWGQNLAQGLHAEYTSYKTPLITEIPRGVMARITVHF